MPLLAQAFDSVESGLLILALMILIGPLVAERLRVPGLIGLIFLGTLFGPFAIGWLRSTGTVAAVGAIGLLYLMFTAALELDINTFLENRKTAITFGLLTFAIPFGLGYLIGDQVLDYSVAAAALLGAMWASHTLVAYPEVKSVGLENNGAVGVAVSSTIITDLLALLILGVATSAAGEDAATGSQDALLPLWAGVLVLGVFALVILPRITEWFFVRVGRTRTERFVFVLAAMSGGAVVAMLGGIEGLVGAFLAGIGINRQVPAHGALMEKVEFFGAALFIPAFLISVGLSIDPRSLAQWSTIRLALLFTGVVVVGKALAAIISGLIFHLSAAEIGVIAALTMGQAAATLAIAQVGVDSGIFDQQILDSAVLTVVLTVLITSLGTRFAARALPQPAADQKRLGEELMFLVGNEVPSVGAVELGVAVTRADDGLLTPYIVCANGECPQLRSNLEEAVRIAVEMGHDSEGVVRVAGDTASGTVHLATEHSASMLMLPWSGPRFGTRVFAGDETSRIGRMSPIPVMATRIRDDGWERVLAITGNTRGTAALREDVKLVLEVARRAADHRDVEVEVFTTEPWLIEHTEDYDQVRVHDPRSGRPLAGIKAGDLVVVPPAVIGDSLLVARRRLTRVLATASLVVVAGPGRLQVSARKEGVAGIVGLTKRDRVGTG